MASSAFDELLRSESTNDLLLGGLFTGIAIILYRVGNWKSIASRSPRTITIRDGAIRVHGTPEASAPLADLACQGPKNMKVFSLQPGNGGDPIRISPWAYHPDHVHVRRLLDGTEPVAHQDNPSAKSV